ncbi:ovalbumin-related protein X-like isoform X2 [Leptopilina heterotoma]|nr:ovalbumin-related protein X-like isoform X2 [Leptopilina heterotoma]
MEFEKVANLCDEVCLASRKFSNSLHKTLTTDTEENVVNSPFSLHTILSLLSLGAENATAVELKSGLFHPETNLESGIKGLLALFNSVKDVDFSVANIIYVQEDLHLNHEFTSKSAEIFGSSVVQVDFKKASNAVERINSWIIEKTRNKIKDLISLDDISDDTRLLMINAVYFKCSWKHKFDPKLTMKQNFYNTKNNVKQVSMMHMNAHFSHRTSADLNARILEIPYQNADFSMVIILPNDVNGLQSLEENFEWDTIFNAPLRNSKVELFLPKFKLELKVSLKETLKKMGISKIFQDDAEFNGISNVPLKVSHVIQKVFIEVDEEGSEAAAASGVQMRLRRSIDVDEPEEFRVDRPFSFIILYKPINIPLFVGSIRDLEAVIEKDEL